VGVGWKEGVKEEVGENGRGGGVGGSSVGGGEN